MKKTLWLLASGLAVGTALLGLQVLLHRSQPPSHAAIAREQPDVQALASELQALRREVRTNEARSILLQGALNESASAKSETNDATAREPSPAELEQARQQEERHREEYLSTVGRAFESESVDRNWSPVVTNQLQQVLAADDIKLAPKALECRSSACKLALDPSDPSFQKGLPLLVNRVGGSLPNTIAHQEPDGHGGSTTVIYLFRGAVPEDPEAG